MININKIGLFRCKSDQTEVIRFLDSDDLEEFQNVQYVTRSFLGTLKGKPFNNSKSARIHQFSDSATKPRDVDARTTKGVLDDLINGVEIEKNFKNLASWYLQTDYAQSGLLIMAQFESDEHSRVAIIKAPFMDDAYEPDEEQVLTKMDQVIKKDLKKGILYPYVTPSGEVRSDEVCLYQTLSGHKFPQHWYKYLQLKANKTSEEMLTEHLETEDSPLDKAESTEEFPEILEDVTDEMGDAKITVEMGNTTVKFTLKEVLEQEDVKLTETQNGFQLVVLGNRPIIKFHNGSEYREILTGVDEYESLRELVE